MVMMLCGCCDECLYSFCLFVRFVHPSISSLIFFSFWLLRIDLVESSVQHKIADKMYSFILFKYQIKTEKNWYKDGKNTTTVLDCNWKKLRNKTERVVKLTIQNGFHSRGEILFERRKNPSRAHLFWLNTKQNCDRRMHDNNSRI